MQKMHKIRVILKGGASFVLTCSDFVVTKNLAQNSLEKITYTDTTRNKPMYVDLSEVAAIVQIS